MARALTFLASALVLGACVTDPNAGWPISSNTQGSADIGALAGGAIGVYMDKQEAELRRRTAGAGITVTRNGDQIELRLPSDVTFATDQASIEPQFHDELNNVASTLVEYPQTTIEIVGHTDSDGSDGSSRDLSERRASSVKSYLAGRGVQATRMLAIGLGETQPTASNETPEGKQQNRRVQIVLTPVTQG